MRTTWYYYADHGSRSVLGSAHTMSNPFPPAERWVLSTSEGPSSMASAVFL